MEITKKVCDEIVEYFKQDESFDEGVKFTSCENIVSTGGGILVSSLIDFMGQFSHNAIVFLGCKDGMAYPVSALIKISDNIVLLTVEGCAGVIVEMTE